MSVDRLDVAVGPMMLFVCLLDSHLLVVVGLTMRFEKVNGFVFARINTAKIVMKVLRSDK